MDPGLVEGAAITLLFFTFIRVILFERDPLFAVFVEGLLQVTALNIIYAICGDNVHDAIFGILWWSVISSLFAQLFLAAFFRISIPTSFKGFINEGHS